MRTFSTQRRANRLSPAHFLEKVFASANIKYLARTASAAIVRAKALSAFTALGFYGIQIWGRFSMSDLTKSDLSIDCLARGERL